MSFRVNINTMGSVVDHKIRMMRSDTNNGNRAVGLDTLIAPIRRELLGAQGNLLQERRNKMLELLKTERRYYNQELEEMGLSLYSFM